MSRQIDMTVASAEELRTARYLIAEELHDFGVSAEDLEDLLLAIHEAAKNGLQCSEGPVQISLSEQDHEIEVSVLDPGRGFDHDALRCAVAPDGGDPCGRGLPLMHGLMDEVVVQILPNGCLVRMAKRLGPAPSRSVRR
jgi:anti-sigma regulatory factor (Ser/Thr protein kinase)